LASGIEGRSSGGQGQILENAADLDRHAVSAVLVRDVRDPAPQLRVSTVLIGNWVQVGLVVLAGRIFVRRSVKCWKVASNRAADRPLSSR
jgi:hypothetical protein